MIFFNHHMKLSQIQSYTNNFDIIEPYQRKSLTIH